MSGRGTGRFTRNGDVFTRAETHATGCHATRFEMLYEPNTSPVRARLCRTYVGESICEAATTQTLAWDFGPALRANGATEVVFVP